MKEILLTQGKVVLVSDHRYEYLMQWKWYVARHGPNSWYAVRGTGGHGNKRMLLMHRAIMNASDGVFVDHIDGDGLNNVDENLRLCTMTENNHNKKINKNNSTGFKGVHKHIGKPKPYEASIGVDNRKVSLGYFYTPEEAALAYDAAARNIYGVFARTNF